MIIYPILILIFLTIAFVIIWRRAYILENGEAGQEGKLLEEDLKKFTNPEKDLIFEEKEDKAKKFGFIRRSKIEEEVEENFKKAEDLFAKKQYISAEKWFLEAVQKDPKNPKIYARLGIIYLEQKNYKDAIEALNESIRLESNVASRHFNLSYAYNLEGDRKNAFVHARRAFKIESANKKYRLWFDELRTKPY